MFWKCRPRIMEVEPDPRVLYSANHNTVSGWYRGMGQYPAVQYNRYTTVLDNKQVPPCQTTNPPPTSPPNSIIWYRKMNLFEMWLCESHVNAVRLYWTVQLEPAVKVCQRDTHTKNNVWLYSTVLAVVTSWQSVLSGIQNCTGWLAASIHDWPVVCDLAAWTYYITLTRKGLHWT